MPTKELEFDELLKEYIEVLESVDVKQLKDKNRIMKVDIERKQKEAEGIDIRIEELKAELDSLNENPTIKLQYPETIVDKEGKIQETKEFKEEKLQEIKKLQDRIKENNKQIRKVNNIGKDVIKKAEEKTNKENEELNKKIEELKIRKAKYGIKRKDKDGNETIQLTKLEKLVVDSIDNDIKKLNKEIRDNKKAFILFKDTIQKAKKDKEVYLALKNKVKVKEKEEQKQEVPRGKREQAPEKPNDDKVTGKVGEKTENNKKPQSTGKREQAPEKPNDDKVAGKVGGKTENNKNHNQ